MTPVLWRLLRTYRWRLAAAMGLQALAGLCSLLPWMLLAWLAEPLARGQAQPALLALVLLAVLAWLGCQALAAHLAHRVDADLCNDLRLRLLAHLQRLPLDWFGRQGPDGVARLVEQDVRALHQLIAHAPNDLSNLLVVPLVALLWLAWLHPWLLLFCLLPLVLAAAGFLLLRSARYRDLVLRRNAALERLSADYGEFAHNLLLARQYPGAGIQQGAEASAAAFGEAFGAWVKRVGHLAALVYVQLSTPWLLAWVLLGALALDALGGAGARPVGERPGFLVAVEGTETADLRQVLAEAIAESHQAAVRRAVDQSVDQLDHHHRPEEQFGDLPDQDEQQHPEDADGDRFACLRVCGHGGLLVRSRWWE